MSTCLVLIIAVAVLLVIVASAAARRLKLLTDKLQCLSAELVAEKRRTEHLINESIERSLRIITAMERLERREDNLLQRRHLESRWNRELASAKEACESHKSKVTWYAHELQQDLNQITAANAQRDRLVKILSDALQQYRVRQLKLEQQIKQTDLVSSGSNCDCRSVLEWAITDRLVRLSGEQEDARGGTADLIRNFHAENLLAQLVVKFPSAAAIDILDSLDPQGKYQKETLDSAFALAEKMMAARRYREANIWYTRALGINAKLAQPNSDFLMRCLARQIEICNFVGDISVCRELAQAVTGMEPGIEVSDPCSYAHVLNALCAAFESYGDLKTTVSIRQRLNDMYMREHREGSTEAADNLELLSRELIELGRFDESLSIGMKALAIYKTHFSSKDERIQQTLSTIARCYASMGKLERATDIYACLVAVTIQTGQIPGAMASLQALESVAEKYSNEQRWDRAAQVLAICEHHKEKIGAMRPAAITFAHDCIAGLESPLQVALLQDLSASAAADYAADSLKQLMRRAAS